jgi:exonuclease SbcC
LRIETITAHAFGPFAGSTLELASGMNVIYGPNESGKSSWHAAIYAGLCGMRRSRGRATREDQAFTNRHRPWRGTSWRIALAIVLDDGRTIDIEQGLGSGGRSTATERATKKPLAGDLIREGCVDAATLLGLTRETAMATLFVRQADVLRVLSDANELQEYLERAAATSAVDTTADEALARITAYKRDQVGLMRTGSRGPLATASRQLKETSTALDKAEERYEGYQDLLSRKHAAELELRDAEARLDEVVRHEQERERRELWREIRTAELRLEQAHQLMQAAGDGSADETATRDLMTRVTRALATFESRPGRQAELNGPSSDEIEQELAATPRRPAGDLEPSPEVMSSYDAWQQEVQRLAAHDEIQPTATAGDQRGVPSSELRRLADELEAPLPTVDAALAEEVARRRSTGATQPATVERGPSPPVTGTHARMSRIAAVVGLSVAVVGAALAILGQPILGAAAIVGGIAAATAGVTLSMRAGRSTAAQAPVSYTKQSPTVDVELTRLEARLVLQEETEAQAQRRRAGANARIGELTLPADPAALRQLAADNDTNASLQARVAVWERRRVELAASWSAAAERLVAILEASGVRIGPTAKLEQALQDYVEACRQRAHLAQKAARRPDLEAQLESRRAAEAARGQDLTARARAEEGLVAIGREAGCRAADIGDMANELRKWMRAQEELDEARQLRAQTSARLDQLLDGRTIDELEAQIIELTAEAGDVPRDEETLFEDRSAHAEALDGRTRVLRDRVAELSGQLEGAEGHLFDVSESIEAAARAEAELHRLTCLAEDLDEAIEVLTAAQQNIHADIAPVLNETIGPWVPRVTQGRYDDIRVNPATLELQAHEAGGQFRPATVLSQGTTEQLFLLLRLALAQHLATTGESAPIILDDVTVQSDAERTVGVLDLLHDLSHDHQVVLFSQEDEVLHWAEGALKAPTGRLICLAPDGL